MKIIDSSEIGKSLTFWILASYTYYYFRNPYFHFSILSNTYNTSDFFFSPTHDAFEDSSRLQALDEIVHRDFKHENNSTTSSSTVYSSCPLPPATEPKRKIAANRRQRGPVIPGEDKEVRKILLHKDLEEFKVEGCLPKILIQKYVKTA